MPPCGCDGPRHHGMDTSGFSLPSPCCPARMASNELEPAPRGPVYSSWLSRVHHGSIALVFVVVPPSGDSLLCSAPTFASDSAARRRPSIWPGTAMPPPMNMPATPPAAAALATPCIGQWTCRHVVVGAAEDTVPLRFAPFLPTLQPSLACRWNEATSCRFLPPASARTALRPEPRERRWQIRSV